MYIKIHLMQEDSSWTWDVAMRITFHGKDRGEWALVDNKYVNLMAYERDGEFLIKSVSGSPVMECYDGVGTKGPAFNVYFAPMSEADKRADAPPGTTWPLDIENPRNPAGLKCYGEWNVISG
jgi:hypothetical protein